MSAEQRQLESYRKGLVEAVRDTGAQAALNFDPDWREAAAAAIRDLADSGREFDAEDVRGLVGEPDSPNALGAAFLAASRARLIEPVGFRKASRIQRHGSWVRTWRGAASFFPPPRTTPIARVREEQREKTR